MGTVFSFDLRGAGAREAGPAVAEAVAWLHRVDELFSPFRPESELSRLVRGELSPGDCDPLVTEVLMLCEGAEEMSDGWFSPRFGGVTDPTGLVKGWAVERASELLADAGAVDSCVNGGGDVQLRGRAGPGRPWRTGVGDPLRPGRVAVVVEGEGRLAVATSGTAERGCHIVDPHTGAAPRHGLVSVTVLAEGLTAADAWATAAFARGDGARDWLESLPEVEGFAIAADGTTWSTTGFGKFTAG
ncbi:FAD:protein FMN transferase [Streptomyces zingiberis]|uniref:FAD:protein FMN transferase n=1 Tax=Streptomyces zingiberis TaxID=2053010 RepID=A0ABX1BUS7_9ACTN|nr:FAD:protein FMN transferase [Streptomyces zingiberis]NJQ01457.1 FAD:protein FMN transferase [Streptomyces zingiberis]